MRMHRFIGNYVFSAKHLEVRDAELANQIKNVLRLVVGDAVILSNGAGKDAIAAITNIGRATVSFNLHDVFENTAEPAVEVTLYCAVLKREHFELVVQKATEAGVSSIVPVLTARTVKQGIRLDRLEKIAREAAEQSGRAKVPAISEPMKLSDAMMQAKEGGFVAFFDMGGEPATKALTTMHEKRIAVMIGPEGGWDPTESEDARRRGFAVLNLGNRTFRAETAAIIATHLAATSQ